MTSHIDVSALRAVRPDLLLQVRTSPVALEDTVSGWQAGHDFFVANLGPGDLYWLRLTQPALTPTDLGYPLPPYRSVDLKYRDGSKHFVWATEGAGATLVVRLIWTAL